VNLQPPPRTLAGQAASPGLVLGRVVEWVEATVAGGTSSRTLDEALAAAVRQLQALRDAASDDSAQVLLEFQIEFLSDPVLLEPAHAALAEGLGAAAAWCRAIDAQIEDFAAAEDDYFRHRVGDLQDMRSRVLAALSGTELGALALPADAILVADDLAPSRFLATDWQPRQAVLLRGGSATAHVALLARARGVAMVVGLGPAPIEAGEWAIVDGHAGTVELAPDAAQRQQFELRRQQAEVQRQRDALAAQQTARTADGERVQVMINVATLAELEAVDPAVCDGIGLVRTELMFSDGPPDETTQLDFYRRLLAWAGGRPVVVRTLDAGGDKPLPGITIEGEANPFLGVRGVRLSMAAPEVFMVQLRALLRAAPAGALRIMLPMVTAMREVEQVRLLLAQCADELTREGLPFAMPPLGVMVEVPAVALALDRFEVDFASIGSNDLLQYTMAAARDNPAVAPLADAAHPGFETLLRLVVQGAAARAMPLSLCGDLASRPDQVPRLLAAGLRSLSMPASAVGAVKSVITCWRPN
jgi:phosphotransferase system enzyme I (PtsI)